MFLMYRPQKFLISIALFNTQFAEFHERILYL